MIYDDSAQCVALPALFEHLTLGVHIVSRYGRTEVVVVVCLWLWAGGGGCNWYTVIVSGREMVRGFKKGLKAT